MQSEKEKSSLLAYLVLVDNTPSEAFVEVVFMVVVVLGVLVFGNAVSDGISVVTVPVSITGPSIVGLLKLIHPQTGKLAPEYPSARNSSNELVGNNLVIVPSGLHHFL